MGNSVENLPSTLKDSAVTTNASRQRPVADKVQSPGENIDREASFAYQVTSATLQESPSLGDLSGDTEQLHLASDKSMAPIDKGEIVEENGGQVNIKSERRPVEQSQGTIKRKHPNDESISIAAATEEPQSEGPDIANRRIDEVLVLDVLRLVVLYQVAIRPHSLPNI